MHSLCEILKHYNVTIQLAAPAALALPSKVRAALEARGQLGAESDRLTPEIVAKTDVVYCTRVQKERFEDQDEYESVKDELVVSAKTLRDAKKNMIVMHPLPRNMELHKEVDDDPRAAYFRQVRLAVPIHADTKLTNAVDAVWYVRTDGFACAGNGTLRIFKWVKE